MKERTRDACTIEAYHFLLDQCDLGNFYGRRNYLCIFYLWHIGLRLGELFHLKWKQVIELRDNGSAMIFEPRTKSHKEIFISSTGRQWLRDNEWAISFSAEYPDVGLHRSIHGRPLLHLSVLRDFNILLREAGNHFNIKLRSHSFRTSLVNRLLENAGPVATRDVIGHKFISTTMRYASARAMGRTKRSEKLWIMSHI